LTTHDSHFRAEAIVQRTDLLRDLPPAERQIFIRFLARGENGGEAPELSGAFAAASTSRFETVRKE
jgi:hypothetical protein